MGNKKELSSDSDTDNEKRQRQWKHQRQQKGNKKPKKRGQSNVNDSDDDFVSTKKVYNSPPKLPNVAAEGRRKNVNPKKPPVSSAALNAALLNATAKDRSSSATTKVDRNRKSGTDSTVQVATNETNKTAATGKPNKPLSAVDSSKNDSPPKLPNVAAVGRRKNVNPKKPPVSSAALNAALLNATTKDRSSSPSRSNIPSNAPSPATAASIPAIDITSHRNTTSNIIGSGRTGSTQDVSNPLPIRQSPPTMEYGSEWDTDGEATIAKQKQMQRMISLDIFKSNQYSTLKLHPHFYLSICFEKVEHSLCKDQKTIDKFLAEKFFQ